MGLGKQFLMVVHQIFLLMAWKRGGLGYSCVYTSIKHTVSSELNL